MKIDANDRSRFVRENLGLVHSCANRFRGRGIEYDDLYGAGCVGLIKAVDGFDEQRGVLFSTYAVPVILGEIKRLFRDGGSVKVSRSLKERAVQVIREQERLSKQLYREPTIGELAEALQLSAEAVTEAIGAGTPPVSLTVSEETGEAQFDIAVEGEEEQLCDRIALLGALELLEMRDRELIALRYFANRTQVQTAKALGMTQVQVSRREKKVLQFLRMGLEEEKNIPVSSSR